MAVLPWRGNPNFVDTLLVVTEAPVSLMGNYHIQGAPAQNAGAISKTVGPLTVFAPFFDIDYDARPDVSGIVDIGADEIP